MIAGGGGRVTRALRLLLLFVLSLAAINYFFGSILETSPPRTNLYTPIYNATQRYIKIENNSEALYKDGRINIQRIMKGYIHSNEIMTPEETTITPKPLPFCNITEDSSTLGPVVIDVTSVPVHRIRERLDALKTKFPAVSRGGRYSPSNCGAVHKVAIIVPFRNRYTHLPIFLNHMHSFLMKQQIEYGIFIVDQDGKQQFNRAKLMNVGFKEAQRMKAGGWQCFIFHDVDLLPMDSRNLYSCPLQPRHMSVSVDTQNFRLPYNGIFGGVSALTLEQFLKVNGFSNRYWGWGGEDDDMFVRLHKAGYKIARYNDSIARYSSLAHPKAQPNPIRYDLLATSHPRTDGLSTLEYEVLHVVQYQLFTHIRVNIDKFHRPRPHHANLSTLYQLLSRYTGWRS